MKRTIALFMMCLGMQLAFWHQTHRTEPDLSIVPNVPGRDAVKAISLGDEQAFFRLLGLQLQNFGDTFGRFTALHKYDFKRLYHWFVLLDTLDHTSNYIPSMATYYFSQTQNTKDVRYIVDYLMQHSEGRMKTKWWWQVQAVYLATHKLKDYDLALKAAKPLETITDNSVPMWVRQMPAFVYEKRGEMDSALQIIENILKNADSLTEGELNFMRYFAEERLDKLDQIEKELDAAKDKAIPFPKTENSTSEKSKPTKKKTHSTPKP